MLEGSHLYGAAFEDWCAQRSFIAGFVSKPGSLLDIGCANGLLLLSLLAWAEHELVPYGIDADPGMVQAARELLPEFAANFVHLHHGRLAELPACGLPGTYDYVYWNVWDDIDFQEVWQWHYAEQAFAAVAPGGRLGLGFYDRDLAAIERKLERLRARFGREDGRLVSAAGGEILAWWKR